MTEVTPEGLAQMLALFKTWLETKSYALGLLVDDEIVECAFPGYARIPVVLQTVTLTDGSKALKGALSYPGPTSEGPGEFQVLYVVGSDDQATHVQEWDDPQEIPQGAVARWQTTFRLDKCTGVLAPTGTGGLYPS